MKFVNPLLTDEVSQRVGDAFVDDTGLGMTDPYLRVSDYEELLDKMKKMGQTWERALFATGGRLELPKCFVNLIYWKWEEGVPRLATIEETPGEVVIKSSADGSDVVIPRIAPNQPHRTVGAWISGSGTNNACVEKDGDIVKRHKGEKDMLKEKVRKVNNRMDKMRLKEHEAAMALDRCFMPSLNYGFPMSALTEKELETVNRQLYKIMKPKMGIRGSTSEGIAHGGLRWGLYGLKQLYNEQSVEAIAHMMGQYREKDSELGKLLRIQLAYAQIYFGISNKIWNRDSDMPTCEQEELFVTHIWRILKKYDAEIITTEDHRVKPTRENEVFIMDLVN